MRACRLNDGPPQTQRQRLLMLAKLMEVWQLSGAPENMSFYAHGQGHAIEHDARGLIYSWIDKHLKPTVRLATMWSHRTMKRSLS